MTTPLDTARDAVVAACRRAAAERLVVGTAGNVSVRVGELVVITATGAVYGELGIPAFEVDVEDTTGCGDAFSAGFSSGSSREAAVLGNAAAAQVVQGLGSDHGQLDLASVDKFAHSATTRG